MQGSQPPVQRADVLFNGNGANGSSSRAARESEIDATAYPILTEEVSFPAAPSQTVLSAPGSAPLAQIVDGALRQVLNWRPKDGDAKGFAAAPNQAFELKDFEGHTTWRWTPRSYTVQTDLGAVTGAQASIYTRAKAALDQSLPLLEGLYTLRADILPEDLESIRAVVRSELVQMVNEFGLIGGPRARREDELFTLLLGDGRKSLVDPESVGGDLGKLGLRFGMERFRVNTIDDEQNLTNYLILVDYVIGLNRSWQDTQRQFFINQSTAAGGPVPFLGTQLVLVARDLEAVAESIQAVRFAMDSVFLGPADRQTIQLRFQSPDRPPVFVADLLDWIERIAAEEGPRLIQAAGKDGVSSLTPILVDLQGYVRAALLKPQGDQQIGPTVPPAYGTPRVQRALLTLAEQLEGAQLHLADLNSPELDQLEQLARLLAKAPTAMRTRIAASLGLN